jgi:hypothetical protein
LGHYWLLQDKQVLATGKKSIAAGLHGAWTTGVWEKGIFLVIFEYTKNAKPKIIIAANAEINLPKPNHPRSTGNGIPWSLRRVSVRKLQ